MHDSQIRCKTERVLIIQTEFKFPSFHFNVNGVFSETFFEYGSLFAAKKLVFCTFLGDIM